MIPSHPEKNPTVVIAHRVGGEHLERSFLDLIPWFENVVVVGPEHPQIAQAVKHHGGSWIDSDSPHVAKLWEEGMRSRDSDWYLLIQSTQYLSTVLKETITETIRSNQDAPKFYTFARLNFFLKQRLKYNLEWTHELPSGLLFSSTCLNSLDEFIHSAKSESISGELVHFGERTLNEATRNSLHRADRLSDQLFKKSPNLNKRMLVSRALRNFSRNFFSIWLVRRGIREGYEGLVFCFLDSLVILLAYLRYYEKYVRSGKQIESQRSSINKILVIKVRGLGDAVLATPVLQNLKTLMPNTSISILTFNFCKPLFENNPNVKEIYGLSEKPEASELKTLANSLSANDFDLIINLHARNLSTKLAKNIKARWRIGRSYFLREKFSDVLIGSDHEPDKSSIERDLDCIRAIGLDPVEKQPELFVTDEESKWANEYLAEQNLDRSKKLIMIHPAVTQYYRHWGLEKFTQLSRNLIDEGHQVMGIFSPMEQSIADLLIEKVKDIYVYVGPLRPSMALIQQADLMIDNDSGPAHVSQALKVPTMVLVGPDYKNTYRDKQIYDKESYVFYQDIPCRDLFFSRCLPPDPCQNRICMDHSVEEVFAKAQELLGSK